ncbi:hypothetical protein A8C75_15540 [Marinobacterium aestuarii]|uniref:Uncharacterized protein n=1 Tax=Marinobacterium aestuarii TaxID=1821621 RepID=A0A1A9F0S7_9GAMM|nr:hypothetical protein [Marinobacterium aestuarii]ANG63747.1 hypothetical protein A8C75_15540 [Marinobacterium aestuarii]
MSPTETGLLILAAILLCTLAASLTQHLVNRRQLRLARSTELQENIRHLTYLADNLPAPFQSTDIRHALAASLSLTLTELQQLAPRACSEQERLTLVQHLEETPDEPDLPPGALTRLPDQHSARRVRALLRDLAQLLRLQQQRQELPSEMAELCLRHIKSGYHRVSCDLAIMDAQAMEAGGRAQVAAHQYRSCLGKLRAIRAMQNTAPQIQNLQTHLEQLERRLNVSQAQGD